MTIRHPLPTAEELALRLRQLNRIGIALSSERDLDRLLDRILIEARRFTRAEAGTLYIRDGERLVFRVLQNDLLPLAGSAGDGGRRVFDHRSIPLSRSSLAGYVGVTSEVVNIPDAYAIPPDRGYSFNDTFDRASGYRTQSMLLVPMLDAQRSVVGVLQLINARDAASSRVPFAPEYEELVLSLASQAAVAIQNTDLTLRLKKSYLETIVRLAIAAEYRDVDTANHLHRMSRYSALLARAIGWSEERAEDLRYAAIMHDVGKIGISDAILLKPGKLTPEEFGEMKKHTVMGARILGGSDSPILQLSETIALTHHEKWNGAGYPRGLSGDAIPIEGRIVALADVFDALTSKRCYKPAFTIEEALGTIQRDSGTHFDPALVKEFLEEAPGLTEIRRRHPDSDTAETKRL